MFSVVIQTVHSWCPDVRHIGRPAAVKLLSAVCVTSICDVTSCQLLVGDGSGGCQQQCWCHQRSTSTTGMLGVLHCTPLIARLEATVGYYHWATIGLVPTCQQAVGYYRCIRNYVFVFYTCVDLAITSLFRLL